MLAAALFAESGPADAAPPDHHSPPPASRCRLRLTVMARRGRTPRVVGRTGAVPRHSGAGRDGRQRAWPDSRHRGGPISAGLCRAGAAHGRPGPPGRDRRGERCRRGCRRSAHLHPEPPGDVHGDLVNQTCRERLPAEAAGGSRRPDRHRPDSWRARCPLRPTRRCGRVRPGGWRATPPAMAGGWQRPARLRRLGRRPSRSWCETWNVQPLARVDTSVSPLPYQSNSGPNRVIGIGDVAVHPRAALASRRGSGERIDGWGGQRGQTTCKCGNSHRRYGPHSPATSPPPSPGQGSLTRRQTSGRAFRGCARAGFDVVPLWYHASWP